MIQVQMTVQKTARKLARKNPGRALLRSGYRYAMFALLALPAAVTAAGFETAAPAGNYSLDRAHASLIFKVDHLGFSKYTARFTRFDASLSFDPARPEAAELRATVDANSIETDFPEPAKLDFNAVLRGEDWLNTALYPEMRYRSTAVTVIGPGRLQIDGELTLHGATAPVQLEATFNGGYAGHEMDPHARIGFSATGSFKRSDFGMYYGIPAPGSTLGVSDAVQVILELEFSGPPLKNAAAVTPTSALPAPPAAP